MTADDWIKIIDHVAELAFIGGFVLWLFWPDRRQAMTDDITNETRAERAQAALQQYVEAKGDVFENNSSEIADLIADLLHLTAKLDQGHRSIESTLRLARLHFEAEHDNPEEMGGVSR